MLVVFLDVEHDRASQLHFGQQVEISQDEEDLALRLELRDHELLEGEKVIILILVCRFLVAGSIRSVVQDLVLAVLAISERENIVPALDHEEGKVEVRELEVDIADLADSLLRLCGNSLGLVVELLARAALIDGHFKFVATRASWVGLVVLLIRRINHN